MQHTVIGMCRAVRPEEKIRSTLFWSLQFGVLIVTIIAFVGIVAFGGASPDCKKFPCIIQPLFNLNFIGYPLFGYIVNFYPLLNLAPTPLLLITFRNGLMTMFFPHKKDKEIDRTTILMTIAAGLPCFLIAIIFKNDVESIMGHTGALGVLLMFVIPLFLAGDLRKLKNLALPVNRNKHESWVQHKYLIRAIVCIGAVFALFKGFAFLNPARAGR